MANRGVILRQEGGFRRTDLNSSSALRSAGWIAGAPLALDANGLKAVTINGGTGACDMICFAGIGSPSYSIVTERIEGAAATGISELSRKSPVSNFLNSASVASTVFLTPAKAFSKSIACLAMAPPTTAKARPQLRIFFSTAKIL